MMKMKRKQKKLKGKVTEGRIALVSPGGCSFFTKVTATLFDLDIAAVSIYLLVQNLDLAMTAEPEFFALSLKRTGRKICVL